VVRQQKAFQIGQDVGARNALTQLLEQGLQALLRSLLAMETTLIMKRFEGFPLCQVAATNVRDGKTRVKDFC
jgi:hypothetical protein